MCAVLREGQSHKSLCLNTLTRTHTSTHMHTRAHTHTYTQMHHIIYSLLLDVNPDGVVLLLSASATKLFFPGPSLPPLLVLPGKRRTHCLVSVRLNTNKEESKHSAFPLCCPCSLGLEKGHVRAQTQTLITYNPMIETERTSFFAAPARFTWRRKDISNSYTHTLCNPLTLNPNPKP